MNHRKSFEVMKMKCFPFVSCILFNSDFGVRAAVQILNSRILVLIISFITGWSELRLAAEEPYVLWATAGINSHGSTATALSPAGDLFTYADIGIPSFASGLLRFSSTGKLIETNRLEGIYPQGLAFDKAGNRYLTGIVRTKGTFDATQPRGFFVAKFSVQNELLWVRDSGESDNTITVGSAIAVDAQGNAHVAGTFSDGDHDWLFLQKYTSDGQRLWVQRVDHQNVPPYYGNPVHGLCVDSMGHVVMTGFVSAGVTDFSGTTVSSADVDWFVARYKPNGDFDWVRVGCGLSVAVDRTGNIYSGTQAGELVKLNTGGEVLWSKPLPVFLSQGNGIAIDANDEPVFTGQFEGTVSLDQVTLRARSSGYSDFFVAKANAQGAIRWAMAGGGAEWDSGNQVACDGTGHVYLTGVIWRYTAYFDGLALVPLGSSYPTVFATKLSEAPPLRIEQAASHSTLAWPAKATNYVLESSTTLPAGSWTTVTNTPTVIGRDRSLRLPATGNAQFFRLHKP
jgi:hypothetical protein